MAGGAGAMMGANPREQEKEKEEGGRRNGSGLQGMPRTIAPQNAFQHKPQSQRHHAWRHGEAP